MNQVPVGWWPWGAPCLQRAEAELGAGAHVHAVILVDASFGRVDVFVLGEAGHRRAVLRLLRREVGQRAERLLGGSGLGSRVAGPGRGRDLDNARRGRLLGGCTNTGGRRLVIGRRNKNVSSNHLAHIAVQKMHASRFHE